MHHSHEPYLDASCAQKEGSGILGDAPSSALNCEGVIPNDFSYMYQNDNVPQPLRIPFLLVLVIVTVAVLIIMTP